MRRGGDGGAEVSGQGRERQGRGREVEGYLGRACEREDKGKDSQDE